MNDHAAPALPPEMAGALGAMHYGLYLLTSGDIAEPRGMLISWVSQISGEPPLVMIAVRHNRAMLCMLERAGSFAVNLLPADGRDLVTKLARPAAERFSGVELTQGPADLPILAQGPGALCCRTVEVLRPGDHAVLLGAVDHAVWRGGQAHSVAQTGHAYLGLS